MAVWFLMFILIYTFQSILMAFFQSAWAVAYLRLTPSVAANVPVVAEPTG
jgi:hypothetical protein